jgi:NAD(P) transhydrogenase subunit alpha
LSVKKKVDILIIQSLMKSAIPDKNSKVFFAITQKEGYYMISFTKKEGDVIVGVIRELDDEERRVALSPKQVAELKKLGLDVYIESTAGERSGYTDKSYEEKGAEIKNTAHEISSVADILAVVNGPLGKNKTIIEGMKKDAVLIGMLEPYSIKSYEKSLSKNNISSFALELVPRITRAQAMDVLSSQANIAGYQSVLIAAERLPKLFPMMMTAAGTIVPSKVLILGAGVAGLQAIATAQRLGAVVSAYDIRAAVKEQVESLGAKFIELNIETENAEGSGGYAKEMGEEFYRKQREELAKVLAEQDVVITTAAIPGKKAPVLITKEMLESMSPGSLVVDIAAERGGNCELTEAGKEVLHNGVTILGPLNLSSKSPYHASQLYSKNLVELLKLIVKDGKIVLNKEDEIIHGCLLTEAGELINETVKERI